jgi:hypothetical protein
MNSREKGKRGEREFAALLCRHGFDARRGQQFAGGAESPDVVCEELWWIHFEVKHVERLNIEDAMEQARRDAARKSKVEDVEKVPILMHKRKFRKRLVTLEAEIFLWGLRRLLARGDGEKLISEALRALRKAETEGHGELEGGNPTAENSEGAERVDLTGGRRGNGEEPLIGADER